MDDMDSNNAWSDLRKPGQLDIKKAQAITLRKNASAIWKKIGLTQIVLSVIAIVCGSLTLYYSTQDMGAPFNIGGSIYPGISGFIAAVLSLTGSRLATLENRITPSRKIKYTVMLYFGLTVGSVFFGVLSLILALWGTAICASSNEETKQHCFPNRDNILSLAIIDICVSISLLLLAFIGICFVFRFGKPYGFHKIGKASRTNGMSSDTREHLEFPGIDNNQLLNKINELNRNDSFRNIRQNTSGQQSIVESRKNALKSPSMVDLFNTATSGNSSTTGQNRSLQKLKSVSTSALVPAQKQNMAFYDAEPDLVFLHPEKKMKTKKVGPMSQMRSKSAVALYPQQFTKVSFMSSQESNMENMAKHNIPVSKTSRHNRKQQGPLERKRSASATILSPHTQSTLNFEHNFCAPGELHSMDNTANSPMHLRRMRSTSNIFSTLPGADIYDIITPHSALQLPSLQDYNIAGRYFEPSRSYHKPTEMKNTIQSIEIGTRGNKEAPSTSDFIPVIKTESDDEDGETESDSSIYTHNDYLNNKKSKTITPVKALKKFKSMQDMFTTKVINGSNRKRLSPVKSLSTVNNDNSDYITSYKEKINEKKRNFINVAGTNWAPAVLPMHNVDHDEIPCTEGSTGRSRDFIEDVTHF